jgi:predicted Kef-type K+ transport protein
VRHLGDSTFTVVAAVLLVAATAGALATRLRQPLIVAFIAVGVLVGPAGVGWVEEGSEVVLLADLGIAVLLFLVGLKLDLHLIRTTGPVAVSAYTDADADQLEEAGADLVPPFRAAALHSASVILESLDQTRRGI